MTTSRNRKTASPGSGRRGGKSTPQCEPTHQPTNETPDVQVRGGPLARRIYEDGGLRDRLREDVCRAPTGKACSDGGGSGEEWPPLRCSQCGKLSPGFVDVWALDAHYECDGCGTEAPLRLWARVGRLVDDLVEADGYSLGAWHRGEFVVCYDGGLHGSRRVATVYPADRVALIEPADARRRSGLADILDDHGVTVRGEVR